MNEQTSQLLTWYDRNRRILPWREDPTPYHIWLSEIMLQQTRVEAGKAYYHRFLEVLPDIASLAAAPEEVYLKLWEGLGYYSRVRNLHRAAVIVMEEYGGELPGTAVELERLPGIGPYSAAAIASIAFGQPEVALDGNLLRLFARMTAYDRDVRTSSARKAAGEYYRERMPEERPGDFNQALMDLGAGICLPNGDPSCGKCPWGQICRAHALHREQEYPVVPPRKERRKEKRTVLLLHCRDRIAVRRRPDKGLLAGLYEFPNTPGHLNAEDAKAYALELITAQSRSTEAPCGHSNNLTAAGMSLVSAGEPVRLPEARHIFSHIEWNMIGYSICITAEDATDKAADPGMPGALIWATRRELEQLYSIPAAFDAYRKECRRWL